jgi:hypothetical protein
MVVRSAVLLDMVEQCFCIEPIFVQEFRVVQVSVILIKVLFVPIGKMPFGYFKKFQHHMDGLFGYALRYEYVSLERMPALSSYKRKTFISEVSV